MPDFHYKAVDEDGHDRRGSLSATNLEAARAQLDKMGLFPIDIRLQSTADSEEKPGFFPSLRSGLSSGQLTLFTRQLSNMSRVVPLEEALRTIVRQSENLRVRAILRQVHAGIVEGRPLSESLARASDSFSPLYCAMVAAGERAGTLASVLDRLADLQGRQEKIRSRIIASVAYPAALAVVAMLTVAALMIFVVPKVVEQFTNVGQSLPLLTRIVIAISDFLVAWGWLVGLGIVAAIALFIRMMRDETFRLRFDRWLLSLPFFGRLIRELYGARLARTLSSMIGGRVPLVEGINLTSKTVGNRAFRLALRNIGESVREGGSLSAALRRAEIFPPLMVYMTAGGESAGRLEEMLGGAADYLEQQFDSFTSTVLSLLEPAVILVMGFIVAVIVLSILLPILQLDTLASG